MLYVHRPSSAKSGLRSHSFDVHLLGLMNVSTNLESPARQRVIFFDVDDKLICSIDKNRMYHSWMPLS